MWDITLIPELDHRAVDAVDGIASTAIDRTSLSSAGILVRNQRRFTVVCILRLDSPAFGCNRSCVFRAIPGLYFAFGTAFVASGDRFSDCDNQYNDLRQMQNPWSCVYAALIGLEIFHLVQLSQALVVLIVGPGGFRGGASLRFRLGRSSTLDVRVFLWT